MASIDTIADRSTGTTIAGKAYFETSTNQFIVYNGSSWIELDSDGVGAVYQNRWGASFDGSGDYITCGNDSSLAPANITLSAWVKINGSVDTWNYILSKAGSKYGAVNLRYTSSNKFNGFLGFASNVYNDNITSSSSYTLTDWHHVVLTYDQTNVKLYVDGVEEYSASETRAIDYTESNTQGTDFFIGRNGYGYASLGQGLIDEVAMFNSALTATQITDIYNSGVPVDLGTNGLNLSPVGWWRMGDDSNDSASAGGSVATITDSSGNGNDATQSTASSQPTFSDLTGESIYA